MNFYRLFLISICFFLGFKIYSQNKILNLEEVKITRKINTKNLLNKILKAANVNYQKEKEIVFMASHLALQEKDTVLFFNGSISAIIPNYIKLNQSITNKVFFDSLQSIKKYNHDVYNHWFPKHKAKPDEECIPWFFPFFMTRVLEFSALRNIPCFDNADKFNYFFSEENNLLKLCYISKAQYLEATEGFLLINPDDYAIVKSRFWIKNKYIFDHKPRFYEIVDKVIEVVYDKKNSSFYEPIYIQSDFSFSGSGDDRKTNKKYKVSTLMNFSESKIINRKKLNPPYF
ncbi:hypothetical protein B0A56_02250 [Flavobacterium columnare NBRC 100251 = ATCC 23463]|nr:hypothetical protein B0A56_02250 [Flavobacterium columnare NBRC 100251 = ATCC 23463]